MPGMNPTPKTTYYTRVDGKKVAAGCVRIINGRRIRFHAIKKWGKLYWSCDHGSNFFPTKKEAFESSTNHDVV